MILELKETTEKVYIVGSMLAHITSDGKTQEATLQPQTINATISTKDLLLALVNVDKVEGMSTMDIFKKVKLIEIIEEADKEVEFTDVQVEALKASALAGNWKFASKFMRDFFTEIGVEEGE